MLYRKMRTAVARDEPPSGRYLGEEEKQKLFFVLAVLIPIVCSQWKVMGTNHSRNEYTKTVSACDEAYAMYLLEYYNMDAKEERVKVKFWASKGAPSRRKLAWAV